MQLREITTGLRFPEGPIAMPDGSFLVVEIERRTLTRIEADEHKEVVAEPGGGPNGDRVTSRDQRRGFNAAHLFMVALSGLPGLSAMSPGRRHRTERIHLSESV